MNIRYSIIGAISLYQRILSPDHGVVRFLHPYGFCRYYPSCSEYALQSFMAYPFFRAIRATVGRLMRCNPWSKGGIDFLI